MKGTISKLFSFILALSLFFTVDVDGAEVLTNEWRSLYKAKISEIAWKHANSEEGKYKYLNIYLIDMDCNNIPEMIVEYEVDGAAGIMNIYTVTNNSVTELVLKGEPSSNGIGAAWVVDIQGYNVYIDKVTGNPITLLYFAGGGGEFIMNELLGGLTLINSSVEKNEYFVELSSNVIDINPEYTGQKYQYFDTSKNQYVLTDKADYERRFAEFYDGLELQSSAIGKYVYHSSDSSLETVSIDQFLNGFPAYSDNWDRVRAFPSSQQILLDGINRTDEFEVYNIEGYAYISPEHLATLLENSQIKFDIFDIQFEPGNIIYKRIYTIVKGQSPDYSRGGYFYGNATTERVGIRGNSSIITDGKEIPLEIFEIGNRGVVVKISDMAAILGYKTTYNVESNAINIITKTDKN